MAAMIYDMIMWPTHAWYPFNSLSLVRHDMGVLGSPRPSLKIRFPYNLAALVQNVCQVPLFF